MVSSRYSPQARQVKSPSETPKDSVWLENRRTQKWMSMTGGISIEDWERTKQKQPAKLKSRESPTQFVELHGHT
ncbi:hypothetical protein Ae201684P_008536 [Aphanomyces euteiches]|nr:hypothetical protein Ae201684P_008536 [Aphanomyces euteiches]